MMPVRRENFERDRAIVAAGLQLAYSRPYVYGAGTERHMQVRMAALVVVKVDVPQTIPPRGQDFACGIAWNLQIRVPDIEMQAERRHAAKQLAELRRRVIVAWQVLDHQTYAGFFDVRHQLPERSKIAFDEETAIVPWRMAVRMHIHPLRSDFAKAVEASAQFGYGGFPDFGYGACER